MILVLDLLVVVLLAFAAGIAVAAGNAGTAVVIGLLLGIFLCQGAWNLGRWLRR